MGIAGTCGDMHRHARSPTSALVAFCGLGAAVALQSARCPERSRSPAKRHPKLWRLFLIFGLKRRCRFVFLRATARHDATTECQGNLEAQVNFPSVLCSSQRLLLCGHYTGARQVKEQVCRDSPILFRLRGRTASNSLTPLPLPACT